jgi:DNA-binding response OmpR family regulator
LRRNLASIDAVIVDLDKHSQALSIVGALGCRENMPPLIVLTSPQIAATAYRHGASICVTKPFSVEELASATNNVCLRTHPFGVERPIEAISICTPKSSLRAPPD